MTDIFENPKYKTVEFLEEISHADYDSRWVNGNSVDYYDFKLKVHPPQKEKKKGNLIKYYEVDYQDNNKEDSGD